VYESIYFILEGQIGQSPTDTVVNLRIQMEELPSLKQISFKQLTTCFSPDTPSAGDS
jgi:hypothetical protein